MSSPVFPANGSLHMAPLFPRSGPGESGSPMSQVLLGCYDFPLRIPGHLFASLPRSTRSSLLRVSQFALPVGGGTFQARVFVRPATRTAGSLARGRERDLPGFQAIHPVPLPRSTTPAEPTTPRLLTVSSMLPPHFPRRRLQRLMNFGALSRGFDTCCLRFKNDVATIPARLTSGWLARLCREGVDPLDRCKRFQVIHPPFLDLAWRKGSFILNLPLASHHSITSSAMASNPGGKVIPSDLAVFRLISSSNLADWTTGSSAGRAPFKMRSTYSAAPRYWSGI